MDCSFSNCFSIVDVNSPFGFCLGFSGIHRPVASNPDIQDPISPSKGTYPSGTTRSNADSKGLQLNNERTVSFPVESVYKSSTSPTNLRHHVLPRSFRSSPATTTHTSLLVLGAVAHHRRYPQSHNHHPSRMV
jgi:hypothetical protein